MDERLRQKLKAIAAQNEEEILQGGALIGGCGSCVGGALIGGARIGGRLRRLPYRLPRVHRRIGRMGGYLHWRRGGLWEKKSRKYGYGDLPASWLAKHPNILNVSQGAQFGYRGRRPLTAYQQYISQGMKQVSGMDNETRKATFSMLARGWTKVPKRKAAYRSVHSRPAYFQGPWPGYSAPGVMRRLPQRRVSSTGRTGAKRMRMMI